MNEKKGFECPKEIKVVEQTPTYVRIKAEPWENGYGHTVGNAMRRVLLSSMEGVAVTSIKIDGVSHEFSSIPGVMEDVMKIVLNVKKLKFNCQGSLPMTLELKADEAGVVTAANIREDAFVDVINKDQVICTLDRDMDFRMELVIDRGRGYRPSEENKSSDQVIGTIPVDSLFSPVERVRYDVQDCRVGQHTDYDSLEMEIWTDGRILPLEAVNKAAEILRSMFSVFLVPDAGSENQQLPPSAGLNEEEKELLEKLKLEVSTLELSVRAVNCLESQNIKYLGGLVEKSENQMLKFKNFGRKSLSEIKEKLQAMGLSLEMNLSDNLKDELQRFISENEVEKEQAGKTDKEQSNEE
ncbi:MAG: DNA-directed RNA polymerase subunit alpha [Victivallales bacterium]|nr:DNA-directed RNA polymerase subunit alpha [Victivallales bacterium]